MVTQSGLWDTWVEAAVLKRGNSTECTDAHQKKKKILQKCCNLMKCAGIKQSSPAPNLKTSRYIIKTAAS